MTDQIGNHGLFCLDDDDFAAVALAMQCNAQATNTALEGINDAVNDYLGRPWGQAISNGALVIDDAAGGGQLGPLGLVGAFLRPGASGPSAPATPTTTSYNMPVQYVATDPTTFMPRGVYLIGSSINWTLGALTANSIRQLLVYGISSTGGALDSSTDSVDLYRLQDYQGDGGANGALTVVGFLDNTAGNIATFEAFFSHANTASDITVANANWRVWATYLGSGLNF